MSDHNSFSIDQLFSLSGKTALITGGSRGIGYMMTQGLLSAGAKVYITARKTEPCLQAAKELSEFGECVAIPADISTNEGREHLLNNLLKKENALDKMINHAGASWGASYEESTECF
jgi:NAD(P)-dependent dehydrogenase (short-subunit alcohol dehydrogenase family)